MSEYIDYTLNDLDKIIKKLSKEKAEKDKEIERLNNQLEEKEAILGGIQQLEAKIEYLEKEKDRLGSLFYERNEENIKLHHIIKEVREYIETLNEYGIGKQAKKELLEILDKVGGKIMQVGDYVRTNEGIGKITKYKYEPEYENCHVIWFDDSDYGIRYADDEIKSSPNLIDLIEIGDYVNGTTVTKVVLDGIECNYIELDYAYNKRGIREKDIKSIVTKEQFEDMEYKIK